MRNPWADEFERDHQAPSCRHGEHQDCPHGVGLAGGLNPRRFRLELGMGLCSCSCHAGCPLSDGRRAVPPSAWRESCSCPGAAPERARQARDGTEPPDFGQVFAEKQRQSELRREAIQAVRAGAAGKSGEQIREMLLAERRARGLADPSDHILDANVEAIQGNYGPALREASRTVARIAEGAAQIFREVRDSGRHTDR